MYSAHLTSGQTVLEMGFEYYTFEVSLEGFRRLSETSDPIQLLVGWYMQDPRPARSEVVGLQEVDVLDSERTVRLTLKVKRGHYVISEFVAKHEGFSIVKTKEGEEGQEILTMRCLTCDDWIRVYKASIPTTIG